MLNVFKNTSGINLGDISGEYKFENCQNIKIDSIDDDSDIEFLNCKNIIFNEFDARKNNIKLKLKNVKGYYFKTLLVFNDEHALEFKNIIRKN
jgi:hypothetical protein